MKRALRRSWRIFLQNNFTSIPGWVMCNSICVWTTLALAFVAADSHAQSDSIFHIYYSSTGTFNKTNDQNAFVLNNNIRFGMDKKIFTVQTTNHWIYGRQSGTTVNNDFSSVVEADVLKQTQALYVWGIGTFDKSFSLKIDHRFQAGAGLGYTVYRKGKTSFIVSDGILYEQVELTETDPETNEPRQRQYDVWRNSFRIKFRWMITEVVHVEGSGFLQPSLSSTDDTIIKSVTGLSVKIKKWFSLTSAVHYNKVTLTGRENLLITYGIVVENYF